MLVYKTLFVTLLHNMNFGFTIILKLLIVVSIADKLHKISDFLDFSGQGAPPAPGQAKTIITRQPTTTAAAVFYFVKSR